VSISGILEFGIATSSIVNGWLFEPVLTSSQKPQNHLVSFFNMTMTLTKKTNNILFTIRVEKYFKHLFEFFYDN
jgi:hypothetical protein